MPSSYRIVHRNRSIIFTFIYGLAIVLVLILGFSWPSNIPQILFAILGLVFLILAFLMGLSQSTYTLIVSNESVSDKDLLHKARELKFSDIESIKPGTYSKNRHDGRGGLNRATVQAPQFINQQFPKFPRFRVSQDVVGKIHDLDPTVKVDVNYNDLIK